MKILLVYPPPSRLHWPVGAFRSRWAPTGLSYLGASLKRAGHDVRIYVWEEQLIKNSFNWDSCDKSFKTLLKEFRPELAGFSLTTPAVCETEKIAGWAREIVGNHIVTVAGGPHASAIPEQTLRDCPSIDVAVIGEGEETLVELAEKGLSDSVAGLLYRKDGAFVQTSARKPPQDLDSLGPPAYELFDMGHYTAPNRWMIRWLKLSAANIRTSRGCTNACGFCAGHIVAGLGLRFHSIEYVLEQVRRAVSEFGVEAVHFEDDTIGANPARLMELCERLRRDDLHKKIVWDCCLRVDQAEHKILAEMKSAGCIQIEYGFECASDKCLKLIDKNASCENNIRAARLTKEAGIRIFADIMFGLPGETEKDIRATMKFLGRANPEIISVMRLTPLPGTRIFEGIDPKIRDTFDWSRYSYFENEGWTPNLTAIPDERFNTIYGRLLKYYFKPAQTKALLRDARADDGELRKLLHRKLRRFSLKHPIKALRLPG